MVDDASDEDMEPVFEKRSADATVFGYLKTLLRSGVYRWCDLSHSIRARALVRLSIPRSTSPLVSARLFYPLNISFPLFSSLQPASLLLNLIIAPHCTHMTLRHTQATSGRKTHMSIDTRLRIQAL